MAVQAYVLIRCEGGRAQRVVEEIRSKDHVVRANTIFGDYDAIARIQVKEFPSAFSVASLEQIVIEEIQHVKGVVSTNTHIVTSPDPDFD